MKTIAAILLAALLLTLIPALAEDIGGQGALPVTVDDKGFAFGDGFTFGMTREEVLARETNPKIFEMIEMLIFEGQQVAGEDTQTVYWFENMYPYPLNRVGIVFPQTYTMHNECFERFATINDTLLALYGPGRYDTYYHWRDETYKDDEANHWYAITQKHLLVVSQWKLPRVEITHSLNGVNEQIEHMIIFTKPGT